MNSVTAVVDGVLQKDGAAAVFDLLGRMPGARVSEGTAGGMFRRAEPAMVQLGDEHQFTLVDQALVHGHVVRGVVLQHERMRAGDLPAEIARIITAHVGDHGGALDAAAALTAARDLGSQA